MGLKGVVNSLPDAKGNLFVQCGIIRSKVNVSDLELIEETNPYETKSKNKGSGISKIKMSKSYSVSSEINLLGKTVDEAKRLFEGGYEDMRRYYAKEGKPFTEVDMVYKYDMASFFKLSFELVCPIFSLSAPLFFSSSLTSIP